MFEKLNLSLQAKGKRVDVLEEEVRELKSQVHRLINEKLVLINGSPRETIETNEEVEAPVRQAGKPKGETL